MEELEVKVTISPDFFPTTANVKVNLSLFSFLTSLCDGINTSLGGVNKLEPIIKDDNIITIIDQNPIYGFIEQLDSSSSLQINLNASFNFSDRGLATLKLL